METLSPELIASLTMTSGLGFVMVWIATRKGMIEERNSASISLPHQPIPAAPGLTDVFANGAVGIPLLSSAARGARECRPALRALADARASEHARRCGPGIGPLAPIAGSTSLIERSA
jgi:hypothetical protein